MRTTTTLEDVTAYPLQWPGGWRRTKDEDRIDSNFGRREPSQQGTWRTFKPLTLGAARDELIAEIKRIADDERFVISTNIPVRNDGLPRSGSSMNRADPGVAVYFRRNGRDIALACDKYTGVPDNMRAIQKTLDAMRGIERWGAHEMMDKAFEGFKALPPGTPPPPEPRPWWEVLMVPREGATKWLVKVTRDHLAKQYHPDKDGGDAEKMAELNRAYEEALKEVAS